MQEDRIRELEEKARDVGLTDDEANELGRLTAEREGKPYANAESQEPEAVEEGEEGTPQTAAEVDELRRHPDVSSKQ